jgi:hypothetical protein
MTSREATQDISNIQAAYELANGKNLINADSFHLSCCIFLQWTVILSSHNRQSRLYPVQPTKNFVSTKRHSDVTAADLTTNGTLPLSKQRIH